MRCKKCDYRLWNLSSRQCPECGTGFLPSDFEFVPGSVRFCCPHCNQAYYGTGAKGHLVPIEFDCGSCGRHIHMDEMVLQPTAGVEEEETLVDRVPWLERQRIGVLKAWFSTIGMAMVNPARLMRGVPGESEVGEAWWFAVATNTPVLLIGLLPIMLLPLGMGIAAGGGFGACAGLGVGLVIGLIVAAIGTMFFIALWAAVAHAVLRATGATASGYPSTGQAICYSTGANALMAIPCLGPYFGWVWWVVSAVLTVKEAQQVPGWRAALAVLTFPFVLLCTLVGLYAGMVAMMLSSAGPFAPSLAILHGEARAACNAVVRYADDHEGRGPDHAVLLVTDGYSMTAAFVSAESETYESDVPVGATSLELFASLSNPAQKVVARRAVDALPRNTIAHRLGDFVFTYHGIDLSDSDPGVWVVVMTADPDANFSPWFGRKIWVGRADGTVSSVSADELPNALREQNELREGLGLPPLPDPTTITHARPAVVE